MAGELYLTKAVKKGFSSGHPNIFIYKVYTCTPVLVCIL